MDRFLKYCQTLDEKEVYAETIFLEKDEMYGIMQIVGSEKLIVVVKIDSRTNEPSVFIFDNLRNAKKTVEVAIKECLDNGWILVRRGKPEW